MYYRDINSLIYLNFAINAPLINTHVNIIIVNVIIIINNQNSETHQNPYLAHDSKYLKPLALPFILLSHPHLEN